MATDDTKLVSTEFTVGGKRWKAEFWPKGGEVDDTGNAFEIITEIYLCLRDVCIFKNGTNVSTKK